MTVLKMKKLGLDNYIQSHEWQIHGRVNLELDHLQSCYSSFKSIEPSEPNNLLTLEIIF